MKFCFLSFLFIAGARLQISQKRNNSSKKCRKKMALRYLHPETEPNIIVWVFLRLDHFRMEIAYFSIFSIEFITGARLQISQKRNNSSKKCRKKMALRYLHPETEPNIIVWVFLRLDHFRMEIAYFSIFSIRV